MNVPNFVKARLDAEKAEAKAAGLSVATLRSMKSPHNPAVVQSLLASGVTKDAYKAVAIARLVRDRQRQAVRKAAGL